MMFSKLTIALTIVIGLVGCTNKVIVPKVTVITPPDHLLTACEIPPPPNKDFYTKADWKKKEAIWVESIIQNYSASRKCNAQITTIRTWKEEQLKAIDKRSKENGG